MKKQILACAVAAAFATGAVAASVTVYGDIDTGLVYSYSKVGDASSTSSLALSSTISCPSRWGLRGSEDLGNGYSVSFDLQNGFRSDDGRADQNGRLFGREARITVESPFGELSLGRMGSLTSAAGKYDIFMGTADLYDGGWTNAIAVNTFFYDVGRCDNMVTYATPSLNGFKAYAQYSFKTDSTDGGDEGRPSAKRYAGVGATYENGPFAAVVVFDSVINPSGDQVARKDSRKLSVGGSYDFDVAKVYVAYQYGKNENMAAGVNTLTAGGTQIKGHNFHVGVAVPVCSGTFSLGGYYTTVESVNDSDRTVKSYNVAATYKYPLSKRTYLFGGVGYLETKNELTETEVKTKAFDATIGLHHAF